MADLPALLEDIDDSILELQTSHVKAFNDLGGSNMPEEYGVS